MALEQLQVVVFLGHCLSEIFPTLLDYNIAWGLLSRTRFGGGGGGDDDDDDIDDDDDDDIAHCVGPKHFTIQLKIYMTNKT